MPSPSSPRPSAAAATRIAPHDPPPRCGQAGRHAAAGRRRPDRSPEGGGLTPGATVHQAPEPERTARPCPGRLLRHGAAYAEGARKYLTASERDSFLREAELADRHVRTLCMTLAYAGCRLSEALALTVDRVDLAAGVLTVESLKKRRTGIYRAVPVPPALLAALDMVHGVRELQARRGRGHEVRLWPWSRMTGWRVVHGVMLAARLEGPHASPKGLRHGFGVAAVTAGIPTQPGAEMARPRPALHHGHLCRCRRRRGERHRQPDVGVSKSQQADRIRSGMLVT